MTIYKIKDQSLVRRRYVFINYDGLDLFSIFTLGPTPYDMCRFLWVETVHRTLYDGFETEIEQRKSSSSIWGQGHERFTIYKKTEVTVGNFTRTTN